MYTHGTSAVEGTPPTTTPNSVLRIHLGKYPTESTQCAHLFQGTFQLRHAERFGQELVEAGLHGLPTVFFEGAGREGDEVGAGTDPTEGTALAIALLKQLAERARLTIATTHCGELKALKYDDPRFENASVAFDVETLSPTYHLQWGIPGRSNALAIATRLGLDTAVLADAQALYNASGSPDKTLRVFTAEEGGAQHCQRDYLTLGVAEMWNWFEDKLLRS